MLKGLKRWWITPKGCFPTCSCQKPWERLCNIYSIGAPSNAAISTSQSMSKSTFFWFTMSPLLAFKPDCNVIKRKRWHQKELIIISLKAKEIFWHFLCDFFFFLLTWRFIGGERKVLFAKIRCTLCHSAEIFMGSISSPTSSSKSSWSAAARRMQDEGVSQEIGLSN